MAVSQAKSLRQQPFSAWEINAASWDEGIGQEGNKYWQRLQKPCLEKFLGEHLKRPGSRALDLATGNGLCARWMASHGANVTATDGARNMVERAQARLSGGDAITFQKLDVTDPKDYETLVSQADASDENKFDVVLMNMAIMDVSTLEHLSVALPKLLKKDGVFAATVLHPVFMTSIYTRTGDSRYNPENRDFKDTIGKTIFEYMHIQPYEGVALIGQAQQQLYFHRPMHELIGAFLKSGLVLDGLEEPCFTVEDAEPGRMLATSNFTQLPQILGFRFRLP